MSTRDIKVEVKETNKYGLGLFASRKIKKDEVIVDYSGAKVFHAEECNDLPKDTADHAVQIGEKEWIEAEGYKK